MQSGRFKVLRTSNELGKGLVDVPFKRYTIGSFCLGGEEGNYICETRAVRLGGMRRCI